MSGFSSSPTSFVQTTLPLVDNSYDLGSSTKRLKDIYSAGNVYLNGTAKGLQILNNKTIDADITGALGTGLLAALLTSNTDSFLFSASGNNSGGFLINATKTRSAATDANTIVQSGDSCLDITVYGADGAAYRQVARLVAAVDGTPGSSDMPGRWSFYTTGDGGTTAVERWRIDNAGNLIQEATNGGNLILPKDGSYVLLGASSVDADITTAFGTTPTLMIVNDNGNEDSIVSIATAANATGAHFYGAKTRSSGGDANTVVVVNDEVLSLAGFGADGAAYQQAARISIVIDGTPGASDMPGRIEFKTTPDGSATPLDRWWIDSAGDLIAHNTTSIIKGNTNDTTDDHGFNICGGGSNSITRGALIEIYGNEASGNLGNLKLRTGDASGADILLSATDDIVFVTASTNCWRINADQSIAFETATAIIRAETSGGSDTYKLSLCGGGTNSASRGSRIEVNGHNHATDAGDIRLNAGQATGASIGLYLADAGGGGLITFHKDTGAEMFAYDNNAIMRIHNTPTPPAGTPSLSGYLYVDAGALKYKGSSGTVTTIANA